jgi:hypothetical protein
MAAILNRWDSPAILINSVADHVHILFCLSKNYALKKVVEEVKKSSSKWIKSKGAGFATFFWQAGYGAFSVSQSNIPSGETVHRQPGDPSSPFGVSRRIPSILEETRN